MGYGYAFGICQKQSDDIESERQLNDSSDSCTLAFMRFDGTYNVIIAVKRSVTYKSSSGGLLFGILIMDPAYRILESIYDVEFLEP